MPVELYEARGRVGGRILIAKVNGHIAELGVKISETAGYATHQKIIKNIAE